MFSPSSVFTYMNQIIGRPERYSSASNERPVDIIFARTIDSDSPNYLEYQSDLDKYLCEFEIDSSTDFQPECVICLGSMYDENKLSIVSCSHKFHTKCIKDWIKIKKNCPICRVELKQFECENKHESKTCAVYKNIILKLSNFRSEQKKFFNDILCGFGYQIEVEGFKNLKITYKFCYWFITIYAKQKNLNIYKSYLEKLRCYTNTHFDIFKRVSISELVSFEIYTETNLVIANTTIAQANWLCWFVEYIYSNPSAYEEMINTHKLFLIPNFQNFPTFDFTNYS